MTTPAGCAVVGCNKVTKKCDFSAPDKDGDTHTAAAIAADPGYCQPLTASLFQPGDDCDDTDTSTHPGAWDGPKGIGPDGATHDDSCNGKDNDCNGKVDDGLLGDGTSCACMPGSKQPCSQDSSGVVITWPGGKPQGACATGTQLCVDTASGKGGQWDSKCVGAVAPAKYDTCELGNDANCDGISNSPADPTKTTDWYRDKDGDGYTAPTANVVSSCFNPGSQKDKNGKYLNCTDLTKPCPEGWTSQKKAAFDCNDDDATVHPGAWDGPMVGYGIQPPGFTANFYVMPTVTPPEPVGPIEPPIGKTKPDFTQKVFSVWNKWGDRGIFVPDPNGNQSAGVQATNTIIVWTAKLVPPATGMYTFQTSSDDGVVLYVDGKKILEDWAAHPDKVNTGTTGLTQGKTVDVYLAYYQGNGGATCQLGWAGPGFKQQPLTSWPASATGKNTDSCNAVDNDCNMVVDDGTVSDGTTTLRCNAVCVASSIEPCGTTMACLNGVYTCDGKAETWNVSACIGQPAGCQCTPKNSGLCGAAFPKLTGACASATTTCSATGQWDSSTCNVQTTETCNGIDDDCDGVLDNPPPAGWGTCQVAGAKGPCASGPFNCVNGALVCGAPKPQSGDSDCGPDALDLDCNGIPGTGPGCWDLQVFEIFAGSGYSCSQELMYAARPTTNFGDYSPAQLAGVFRASSKGGASMVPVTRCVYMGPFGIVTDSISTNPTSSPCPSGWSADAQLGFIATKSAPGYAEMQTHSAANSTLLTLQYSGVLGKDICTQCGGCMPSGYFGVP